MIEPKHKHHLPYELNIEPIKPKPMKKEVTIAQKYLDEIQKGSKPIVGTHAVPYNDKFMELIVDEKMKLNSLELFFDEKLKIRYSKEADQFNQKLIEKFKTFLDCCSLQIQLADNLILHYIEGDESDWDNPEQTEIDNYTLSIGFRDCHYYLTVPRGAIEEDFSAMTLCDGDSDLFDSFESKMQDDYWEYIKLVCARYKELAIAQNVELYS